MTELEQILPNGIHVYRSEVVQLQEHRFDGRTVYDTGFARDNGRRNDHFVVASHNACISIDGNSDKCAGGDA